jgi:hypothetical protein
MNRYILFAIAILSGFGIVLSILYLISPKKGNEGLRNAGRGLRYRPLFRFVLLVGVVLTIGATCIHPILGVAVSSIMAFLLLVGMKAEGTPAKITVE